jgi:hypothetical protein
MFDIGYFPTNTPPPFAVATDKRLSRLWGNGTAEKYAEQNGGENGEWQNCIRWRAGAPAKLLVQQFLIAPSHRGPSSNRGYSPQCAGLLYPHVWTAPSWQGESSRRRLGRCARVFGLSARFT